MTIRTLDSLGEVRGKKILLRCDLNVPITDGVIGDDGRIVAALPTIRNLVARGATIIILSHLGRPEGIRDSRYTMRPVADRLSELLEIPVSFVEDTVGSEATTAREKLGDAHILFLENLRFNAEETSRDPDVRRIFAAKLAHGADAVVSDGFGVVHRKHASVYELAQLLPSAAGLLVESELRVLEQLVTFAERPYSVVLGGSKVSDKLGVISHLLPKIDSLMIGGGMLFTFLAAQGFAVASSLLEADHVEAVRGYCDTAKKLGVKILLPTDVVVASHFSADAPHQIVPVNKIEETSYGKTGIGLDIGPETSAHFAAEIGLSRTVFWNGPMGVFEFDAFSAGTRAVANALAHFGGLGVVGGGDSAAAVRKLGFSDHDFGHISTGGGASLEFLEGNVLPGLEVLGWEQNEHH